MLIESATFPRSQDGLRAGGQAVSKEDIHGGNYDTLARIVIVFIAPSLLRVVLALKTFTTFFLDLIRLLQSEIYIRCWGRKYKRNSTGETCKGAHRKDNREPGGSQCRVRLVCRLLRRVWSRKLICHVGECPWTDSLELAAF